MFGMHGVVPRALWYVAFLFTFCLASTFAWWIAANVARTEWRRLLSALACSMRIFFYSICLLCILVVMRTLRWEPRDPKSSLFSWIHVGGTVWISIPSAWRAFRDRTWRLGVLVVVAWGLIVGVCFALARLSPDVGWWFRNLLDFLKRA